MSALAQVLSYGNFVDGLAGMSGGISAITIFYPLNKIRMDLQNDSGLRGQPSARLSFG